MIVSGFRAALDLNTYPLSIFIRPLCAERAKPSRGKPVLMMHIGFFACFHAIYLERSRFSEIATLFSCSCSTEAVASVPGLPRSVRVLIMRRRFSYLGAVPTDDPPKCARVVYNVLHDGARCYS